MMGNLFTKKLLAIALVFGVVGMSSSAMATRNSNNRIYFDTWYIWGSLADARNSNTVQYMSISDGGSWMSVYAQEDDRTVSCITSDAAMMALMRTVHPDTTLYVEISEGTCTHLFLQHYSGNAPKNH